MDDRQISVGLFGVVEAMPEFRSLDVEPFSSTFYGLEMEVDRSDWTNSRDKQRAAQTYGESGSPNFLFCIFGAISGGTNPLIFNRLSY